MLPLCLNTCPACVVVQGPTSDGYVVCLVGPKATRGVPSAVCCGLMPADQGAWPGGWQAPVPTGPRHTNRLQPAVCLQPVVCLQPAVCLQPLNQLAPGCRYTYLFDTLCAPRIMATVTADLSGLRTGAAAGGHATVLVPHTHQVCLAWCLTVPCPWAGSRFAMAQRCHDWCSPTSLSRPGVVSRVAVHWLLSSTPVHGWCCACACPNQWPLHRRLALCVQPVVFGASPSTKRPWRGSCCIAQARCWSLVPPSLLPTRCLLVRCLPMSSAPHLDHAAVCGVPALPQPAAVAPRMPVAAGSRGGVCGVVGSCLGAIDVVRVWSAPAWSE